MAAWLPLEAVNAGQKVEGELRLEITYKPFVDDDMDSVGSRVQFPNPHTPTRPCLSPADLPCLHACSLDLFF